MNLCRAKKYYATIKDEDNNCVTIFRSEVDESLRNKFLGKNLPMKYGGVLIEDLYGGRGLTVKEFDYYCDNLNYNVQYFEDYNRERVISEILADNYTEG